MIGYLLLFFSYSIIIFKLKMKIPDNWRYVAFVLSQIFGFILFFLYIAVYTPLKTYESNIFYDLPIIIGIGLIVSGPLMIILGIKESWDDLWKITSISASEIIGVVILILGFIVYENSNSKWALFSSPSTPEIYIGIFLIISGISVSMAISGAIAMNFGLKIRNRNFNLLLISIFCSSLFYIIGATSLVLEYVSINTFNLFYSSVAIYYILISMIFSISYIIFLVLLDEEIFQLEYQIKSLDKNAPIKELSEITKNEVISLNEVDILNVSDLANEEDMEGISKITKIKLSRLNTLKNIANRSIKKKRSYS